MLEFKDRYIVLSRKTNIAYRFVSEGKSPFSDEDYSTRKIIIWPDDAKCVIENQPVLSIVPFDIRGIFAFRTPKQTLDFSKAYFDTNNVEILILDYDYSDFICDTSHGTTLQFPGYNIPGEIVLRKANILYRTTFKDFSKNHKKIMKDLLVEWQDKKVRLYTETAQKESMAEPYRLEGNIDCLRLNSFLKSDYSERLYKSEFHGLTHSYAVLNNAMKIADKLKNIDRTICTWFSFIHDCMRENDGEDLRHGIRAAELVDRIRNTYLTSLSDFQIGLLKKACMAHTFMKGVHNNTVGVCVDADRLCLSRVGITPYPNRMVTEAGWIYASILCDEQGITYNKDDYFRYIV